MIRISATKLRNNLFDYLQKAENGEIIVIQRNRKEVARLTPTEQTDWRMKMRSSPELLVAAEALIEPVEGIWEEYV